MEELDGFTKELFQIGLKEWRVLYYDNCTPRLLNQFRIDVFRIVAFNSRDALFMLLRMLDFSSDYITKKIAPGDGIEKLASNFKDYGNFEISEKWNGVFPADHYPGIYRIDPYDGELTFMGDETLLEY